MGPVMIAAFVEWFLFLAAFVYCLVKVYQKADEWSTRVLAVVMIVFFCSMRLTFLPVMVVTLPLPAQVTQYFPTMLDSALSWFAFYTFAGLLSVPFLICLWQVILKSIGRKRMIGEALDEKEAPKTVVVMPCYKEKPEVLLTAINSVVDCEYPASCLHVFLSFDGDQEDETYLTTLDRLGIPLSMPHFPRSIDTIYRGARVTVSKFPHGGKRKCQKQTFKLIDSVYAEYLKRHDNLFVLFIDSDCILDAVCVQNFMYEMELKSGPGPQRLAMTGVITCTTGKQSFITLLQDMEYIHGQLFERATESACGAVTCLPGALTMLRFSAFRGMAKYYFADKAEQCDDLFDYAKCHLGEDRWLTHLFMVGAQHRYQVQMSTTAFCKTEAVQTFASLLKQRRRWFLGYITNEACMLTDVRLWKRYPVLCVARLAQSTIRTTALLFFIMLLAVASGQQRLSNLPIGFIAISLGLNWAMMVYFGIQLRRFKMWLYPLMFVANPVFNWIYMVYGICTAGQRTWGGPRADAGAADAHTTAQQAIEHARATGDDLNVVPESFKAAARSRHPRRPLGLPLHPTGHVEGRFRPASLADSGLYRLRNDSGLTLPNMLPRPGLPFTSPESRRASWNSVESVNDTVIPRAGDRFANAVPHQNPSPPSPTIQSTAAQSPAAQSPTSQARPPLPARRSSYAAPTWRPPPGPRSPAESRRTSYASDAWSADQDPIWAPDADLPPPNPYARYRTSRPSPLGQVALAAASDDIEAQEPLPPPATARAACPEDVEGSESAEGASFPTQGKKTRQ